ncbi:aminoglycoside adenylyltransferase domain-containing protein [Piscibacillus halophilus]|uniref:aminoglycoside adenylyltransferase domain-containing protein n=1 Tax=Piscibacillus halophilus TaxID=571933 RepID=UPI00240A86D8|nr:aminoglycoside adenylyltransferase domain-containing protein [Piscibacillus halophilus]
MGYDWETCPSEIKEFVLSLQQDIAKVVPYVTGIYLHGSLAMGGFNPNRSDVDILVVTKNPLTVKCKKTLAQLFLDRSNSPYPIEISFLNIGQLHNWQHPCPYDFHYSEYWRDQYKRELMLGTSNFINEHAKTDGDLAAHITIINHKGISLEGKPIEEVFPPVPNNDYISSISTDFEECLDRILIDPIYCTLNLLRVYWYLKDGKISSKQEAGQWGMKTLPQKYKPSIEKVIHGCHREHFRNSELLELKNYIADCMKNLTS